ncbi:response regulator transcription factor [Alteromonas sp. KUL49]|uniref:response regulator transcription factor n=1 Tax=Alteromonas sp. KUL49 TaxID=2480798 RepID=UPI00102F0B23|nr:response regulator transcription factor [Alteromonas sp. KUL49]TAP40665.1 response regulator transcription factor [Alteromonas sp. KUL49]GEA10832.1 DNA-binding response regulator [Alteromonas sp. KUL49]
MQQDKLSILLIEDNLALAGQITRFLEGLGWLVDFADRGQQGMRLATSQQFDVVILDLNLPDCDGLAVCEHIKKHQTRITPILMLTARDGFEDKAKGFAQGTDDYLTKPCDLRELAMRCKALARRPSLHSDTLIQKGRMSIDSRAFLVKWNNKPIKVTKVGFKILKALIDAYPYPVARTDLIQHVWGDEPPESNALKSHMYSLRKAIEQQSNKPILKTISNLGYQLQGLDDE